MNMEKYERKELFFRIIAGALKDNLSINTFNKGIQLPFYFFLVCQPIPIPMFKKPMLQWFPNLQVKAAERILPFTSIRMWWSKIIWFPILILHLNLLYPLWKRRAWIHCSLPTDTHYFWCCFSLYPTIALCSR